MVTDLRDLIQTFSKEDWTLLDRLSEARAGTATDLAVRLRVMPDAIEPRLKEFAIKDLVEVSPLNGPYDHTIYRISDKGRKVLRLVHPV